MNKIFNADKGSAIRAVIRTGVVLLTAFGTGLGPEQIAAIQLFLEAVLQAGVIYSNSPLPPPQV